MKPRRISSVKPEIRVVGVDDGVFVPRTRGKCEIVGVVFRGGFWLDGIMRTQVEVDGMEATEKIAGMISGSPHYGQLRVIMLNGVTFAGFNVVDTMKLFELTGLPVIVVTREKPDFDDIRKALSHLPFAEERWEAVRRANRIVKVSTSKRGKAVFMQVTGVGLDVARKIVKETSTRSNVPEALRVAHLIASGLTAPPRE